MKRLLVLFILLLQNTGCSNEIKNETNNITPTPNQFKAVWNIVNSNPYKELPQDEVSFGKLFTWSKNIILSDAKRTLENRADILPSFNKLAHPNGVCMQGLWEIKKENPYSGYFKQGSQALIIARASSAMSNTKKGEIRAFGLAGKLFPTIDPLKINAESSANFFVIDDLGGTKAEHFTDVALTNAPPLTTNSEVLKHILYGLKVSSAFKEADKNPTERQLYEISELLEKGEIKTPKWLKITAKEGQTVDTEDFRNEFKLKNSKKLVFNIAVASSEKNGEKEWKSIGNITFKDSVASYACDHQLHFHHAKWR
jgi:hypothetical protein